MEKHLAAAGSSGSIPLFGVVWSWFMVHVAPPPLGPTSGPPLVHLVAPPWSIRWLPLPLIPLWIGRSSVGVQAERSEPQPTKRTTSNLTPIAVGTVQLMGCACSG